MSSTEKGPAFTLPDVGQIDISKLTKGRGDPDYIMSNPRGRDIFSRLVFNTGVFWLGGFGSGGAVGMVEGWRGAASPTLKIRMNSILNAVSMRGSKLGNALGVIAFTHTVFVGITDQLDLEHHSGSSVATPIVAGFMTGALYKSTTGPRGALLAATIGAAGSCAYWYGSSYIYNSILGRGGRF